MLIVTAGTAQYSEMLLASREKAASFGYRTVTYDLGGLGTGTPWEPAENDFCWPVPKATFKPKMLMEQWTMNSPLAWLDGDTLLIRAVDDLFDLEFDVAVTLREPIQLGQTGRADTDYLNSGVVFFQPTEEACRFIEDWDAAIKSGLGDQQALNEVAGAGMDTDAWRMSYGDIHVTASIRVLVLDAREWNFWNFPQQPGPAVRILHFKRGLRDYFKGYVNNRLYGHRRTA